MSSSSQLVLITGATGHIGFKVALDTLKAGHRIRLAVRSDSKKQVVLSNPAFKKLSAEDRVTFVIVPDLTAVGAYDEAVKGVDVILHIASPITNGKNTTPEEYQQNLILPAVHGTVGILDSAAKHGSSVKRIVITSSIVAIVDFQTLIGQGPNAEVVKYAESRTTNDDGPYYNEFHAYSASKVAALNATEKWFSEKKPKFDVVHIHPAFVEGRNDLATSAAEANTGTNAVMIGIATGNVKENPLPGATVHLDDVSRAHVGAIDKKIPAGSYLTQWSPQNDGSKWEDVNGFVQKHFPKQVESGLLNISKVQASSVAKFDSSKTEKTFGFKFLDLEEQVKSVIGQYVELSS